MISTPIKLVDVSTLERHEWLEYRKNGIGGSDVGAICNLSRFRSPLAVFLDKTGQIPETPDNPRMEAGRRLEQTIADWFSEVTNIASHNDTWMYQHPEHPFMLANVDRWVTGENAGLEIKNTSEFSRHDWFDGPEETIPVEYMLQCNHYMAVTGAERWYIAVLIGGWDLQWRVIERDDTLISNLIAIESQFWQDVQNGVAPAAGTHDTDVLKLMHPEADEASTMSFNETDYDLLKSFFDTKKDAERANDDHEKAKNMIKQRMGSDEVALWQGEKVFSWKNNKKGVRVFKSIGGI